MIPSNRKKFMCVITCLVRQGLAVNMGKNKYIELGRHYALKKNKHITVDSNSYDKVKIFKYSILLEIKCRLKAEIHVLNQPYSVIFSIVL